MGKPEELQPLSILIGREKETWSSREGFSRDHRAKKSLLEGSDSPDLHTNSLLTLFL